MTINAQQPSDHYAAQLPFIKNALEAISDYDGTSWRKACETLSERYPAGLFFHALTLYAPERARHWQFHKTRVPARPIRRIAIVCAQLAAGGAERCAALLIRRWIASGYEVMLLTSSPSSERDYPTPPKLIRREVPQFQTFARLAGTESALTEFAPDCCVTIDHHDPWALSTLLTANRLGIRTAAMEHSAFAYILYSGEPELFFRRQAVYSVCDAVTCLSRADELILRNWNLQAVYMPNPLTFAPDELPEHETDNRTIIFVGRLTADKGATAALYVLRRVRERHEDARLLLAGDFIHPNYKEFFYATARRLGVEDAIEATGQLHAVDACFRRSSVHIMPSVVEGFPMTLMEAKAAHVPSVTFSMPYLEAAHEHYGCIQVGKEDVEGMAQVISELFANPARLRELGEKAHKSLDVFSDQVVFDRWEKIFQAFAADRSVRETFPCEASTEQQLAWSLTANKEFFYGVDHCLGNRVFVLRNKKSIMREYLESNALAMAAHKISCILDELLPPGSTRRKFLDGTAYCLMLPVRGAFLLARKCYRLVKPYREPEEHIC